MGKCSNNHNMSLPRINTIIIIIIIKIHRNYYHYYHNNNNNTPHQYNNHLIPLPQLCTLPHQGLWWPPHTILLQNAK